MTSVAEIVQKLSHAKSIGASNIAGILDISPFSGPWQEYARITGLTPQEPPDQPQRWGLKLQRPIAEIFTEDTGMAHEWNDKRIVHRYHAWQHASPDALMPTIIEPKAVLEVKTTGGYYAGHWGKTYGEMGDEEGVPEYYLVQLQWQMSVTGVAVAYVAVLIGGHDFRYYRVPFDPELTEMIEREGEDFFRKYILTGEAPPPTASEEFKSYLKLHFPRETGPQIRQPNEDELELLAEYADVRARLKPLEAVRADLEAKLKRAVGESAGIESAFAKFTYKWQRGKREVQWRQLAESQIEAYSEDEQKALKDNFTRPGDGYRKIYFHDKRREDDDED